MAIVYYCNYHYTVSRLCNIGYVSFILWFIKDFKTSRKCGWKMIISLGATKRTCDFDSIFLCTGLTFPIGNIWQLFSFVICRERVMIIHGKTENRAVSNNNRPFRALNKKCFVLKSSSLRALLTHCQSKGSLARWKCHIIFKAVFVSYPTVNIEHWQIHQIKVN